MYMLSNDMPAILSPNQRRQILGKLISGEYEDLSKNLPAIIDNIKSQNSFDKYSNSDISVTSIAEEFKKDQSYLSRVFKQNMKIGMLDYLNHKRITESKSLLISSDKSISDISASVGFISTNTYIRVFKRYEVITPGSYR